MSRGVIAFSGGLDTSFLVPFAKEKYGIDEVITCTVDTGGFGEADKAAVEMRALEVGASRHEYIDASQLLYDEVLKYLIFGNVTRDGYPLCVSSERMVQAREALHFCRRIGADTFIHGCTGAGNDQYRFDLVAQVLGQWDHGTEKASIQCLAPIREFNISREFSTKYLEDRGFHVPGSSVYSYNVGLWGTSIGGKETLTSTGLIPEEAWHSTIDDACEEPTLEIHFEKGEPLAVTSGDSKVSGPVEVIQFLNEIGG